MKNGGLAFPVHTWISQGGQQGYFAPQGGMSLRDYFAAQVAPSFSNLLLTDRKATATIVKAGNGSYSVGVAKMAYGIADAMLAEREKS